MVRYGTTGASLIAAAMLLPACGGRGVPVAPLRPGTPLTRYELSGEVRGNTLTAALVAPEGYDGKAKEAFAAALAEVDRWETMLSATLPDSPVAKVNAAAGASAVEVPDEVIAAFEKARAVSHASKGAIGGGFEDVSKIEVNRRASTVALEGGVTVAFDAFLPGIGADAAIEALRGEGFSDARVEYGRAMFASGDAGGKPWSLPVKERSGDEEPAARVELRDQGLVSHDGVTVIADDAVTADAYGSAIRAAGIDAGTALLLARKLQGILFLAPTDGSAPSLKVTSGLKGRIETKQEVVWIGGTS